MIDLTISTIYNCSLDNFLLYVLVLLRVKRALSRYFSMLSVSLVEVESESSEDEADDETQRDVFGVMLMIENTGEANVDAEESWHNL